MRLLWRWVEGARACLLTDFGERSIENPRRDSLVHLFNVEIVKATRAGETTLGELQVLFGSEGGTE